MELPLQYDNTTVIREDNIVRVENARGMVYECDINRQRCTLHLSGWYYNKVAGLLGTYDNEAVNDFSTPSMRVARNVQEFTSSWQVGKSCQQSQNLARPLTRAPSAESVSMCKQYFESRQSPLSRCFGSISPKKMEEMCIYNVETSNMDSTKVLCNAVDVYIRECRMYGIDIQYPKICSEYHSYH